MTDQDLRISETVQRERGKLRSFIRRYVTDQWEADDILQDVFYEFVLAARLAKPIENAGAWLYRVARNRITDLFRKKKPSTADEPGWEDLLPSPAAGPDAEFARRVLIEELEEALESLSAEQREVFLAHEVEGRSFEEISRATGVNINTLLARKRRAVIELRRRLNEVYREVE